MLYQRLILRNGLKLNKHLCFASTVTGSNIQIKIRESELVKEDSEMLQPITIEDLPRAQRAYAKKFEEINFQRITEIFKLNRKVGFFLKFFVDTRNARFLRL